MLTCLLVRLVYKVVVDSSATAELFVKSPNLIYLVIHGISGSKTGKLLLTDAKADRNNSIGDLFFYLNAPEVGRVLETDGPYCF